VLKDAASDEPQGFDWSAWLTELGVGTIIVTSTWTVTGPDAVLTTHDPIIVTGAVKTQVYLNAGTPGKRYTVTNRIQTNNAPPVTDERSFKVLVQNR
jgi:hypothetical protein